MKKVIFLILGVILIAAFISTMSSDKPASDEKKKTCENCIPGLAPVDVYKSLEDRGFDCKMNHSKYQVTWRCTNASNRRLFDTMVFSKKGGTIKKVEVTVMNYSNMNTGELSRDYFGLLATLPYDGSEPHKAKRWVQSNINRTASTTIGGIKYKIYANAKNNRILEISK